MCCMASLSQRVGWLLLPPEPNEQQRQENLPLGYVFVSCLCLVASAYDYLVDGVVSNGFTLPILGLFCFYKRSSMRYRHTSTELR